MTIETLRKIALDETRWFTESETAAQIAVRIEAHRARIDRERNTQKGC